MALSTYTELKTSIANHLDRADLTSAIPDFITIFEAVANNELALRTRFNTAKTTLSLTSTTVGVALPLDFLEAQAFVNTTLQPVEIIPPTTPAALYTSVPDPTTSGSPRGVVTIGGYAEFAPVADQTYAIDTYYYKKVVALAANETNWLLTNIPSLYLYGSLIAAEAYLGDDPRIKIWGNLYDNIIKKIDSAAERGIYGGAPLSVKLDAVV